MKGIKVYTMGLLLAVLVCFKSGSASAQQDLVPQLPVFITPSPQATAITRYGDYPVDYSRGLVDMSMHLYEIKSKSLRLSMNISFHASGRMANETNGILGMRWTLQCGGVVTREMRGRPDEWNALTPHTVDPNATPGYEELYRSCTEYYRGGSGDYQRATKYDSEYDVFRYMLPTGKSGQFILKNVNGIKKTMTIPYEPLKIEMIQDHSYYGYYGAVNITDVDGTIYCYGNGTLSDFNYYEANVDNPHQKMPGSIPTGWYLRCMISADRQDTIYLEYENNMVYKSNYNERITVSDRIRDYSDFCEYYPFDDPYDDFGPSLIDFLYQLPRDYEGTANIVAGMRVPFITSIKFDQGEVNFKYVTDSRLSRNNIMLNEIEINGAIHRKINFETFLHANEKDIHYLKTLQIFSIQSGAAKIEEKYAFEYYEPASSSQTFNLHTSAISKDWWGYYNKNILAGLVNQETGVPTLPAGGVLVTPERDVPFIRRDCFSEQWVYRTIGSHRNRDTDLESKKIGMLKSINYPTGGKTLFDYENNFYTDNNYILAGPGIRILEILDVPNQGKNLLRWFKYGDNENDGGFISNDFKPGKNSIQESGMMLYWDLCVCCDDDQSGLCVVPKTKQLGYRIRSYLSDPETIGGDNNIWYKEVVEYKGLSNHFVKDVYSYHEKYYDAENFIIEDSEYLIEYPKVYINPYRSWKGGKIDSKTSYKKTVNGQYIPVMQESFDYAAHIGDEAWDMPTYRHVAFSVDQSETLDNPHQVYNFWYNAEQEYHEDRCSVIGYGYRHYVSGVEKLAKKITDVYTDNGTVRTVQDFVYDQVYHQVKQEIETNSNGKAVRIEYEYPFDDTSLDINSKLVGLNMIANPLRKSHYVNETFMQHKRTAYKEWGVNLIRPEKEFYKNSSHDEELLTQFANYDDKGNPLEVNHKGSVTAYYWSYDKIYPVVKAENISSADLATKVNAAAISAGIDLNDWISDPLALKANWEMFNSALRSSCGPSVHVTTYTYKPLVGMSSSTDVAGITTYYEYDGFGRLALTRDHKQNILKTYTYHYMNQE